MDHFGVRVVFAWAVLTLVPAGAHAERYVVQRGETLEHVAEAFGCTTAQVLKANNLDTTLVKPGTVIQVPSCTAPIRKRAQTRTPKGDGDADEKAREALAVIDGTAIVRTNHDDGNHPATDDDESVGEPWRGELHNGRPLPAGEGYQIRRPSRSYGASHVVTHLRAAIAEVRALYSDVHTLAIGDLSAQHGGKIAAHASHQSGLDVDVGFYFRRVPKGYPESFVAANADFDLEANWALLVAFQRTIDQSGGVQMIFVDYEIQARLYRWAVTNGTPKADLEKMFQYPRGKDVMAGMVRHWPNHADHFHVRFKPAR